MTKVILLKKIGLLFIAAFLFIALLFSLIGGSTTISSVTAADPNNIVNYQGRILDANGVPETSATISMEFRFFDAESGGTCLWSNSSADCDSNTPASTTARTVSLSTGLFSENLGDTGATPAYAAIANSVFADNAGVYLEVEIDGETLSPRKLITATPFALNAQTLDGVDSASFLQVTGGTLTGNLLFEGGTTTPELRFDELSANGDNYVAFQAPDSLAGDVTWTLPTADGTNGQVLTTNGFGVLSWSSGGGGGSTAFSGLTAATGTNSIDNENYAQTWAWSTADTENPLTITGNALTTGTIATISSTSGSRTSGELFSIDNTATYSGSITSSGSLLNINRDLTVDAGFTSSATKGVIHVESDITSGGSPTENQPLLRLDQNYASAESYNLHVENAGTRPGIYIDQNGDTGSSFNDTVGGALHISNTGNAGSGLTVYSNNTGVNQVMPLLSFHADESTFDQPVINLQQDGTGDGIFIDTNGEASAIRIDSEVASGSNSAMVVNAALAQSISAFVVEVTDALTTGQGFLLDYQGSDADDLLLVLESDFAASNSKVFTVDSSGSTTIGVDAEATTGGLVVHNGLQADITGSATTNGVCHTDASGTDDQDIVDCSGSPSDIAEWYETTSSTQTAMIVSTSDQVLTYESDAVDPFTGHIIGKEDMTISVLEPSSGIYDDRIIGIVSTSPVRVYGEGVLDVAENPLPIAAVGRVPLKVTSENGAIRPGDPITSSSIAGVGMKSTESGKIVGYALDSWSGVGIGTIIVYVSPTWHGGTVSYDDELAMRSTNKGSDLFLRGTSEDTAVQTVALSGIEKVVELNFDKNGRETALISEEGDLAIAGNFYPSNNGELQTEKFIFYNGGSGLGEDYISTNAKGWAANGSGFAESFRSNDALEAGEVVALSSESGLIERASQNNEKPFIGIVSGDAGFLGASDKGDIPVVLSGRASVKVNDEGGEIKSGDPLSLSSIDGFLKKANSSEPILAYAMSHQNENGLIAALITATELTQNYIESPVQNSIPDTLTDLTVTGQLLVQSGTISGISSLNNVNGLWSIDASGNLTVSGDIIQVIAAEDGQIEASPILSEEKLIQLTGTEELNNGEVNIDFKELDTDIVKLIQNEYYKVIVTAKGPTGVLYIDEQSVNGFTIKEVEGKTNGVFVDWVLIATRNGDEIYGNQVPEEEIIDDIVEEEMDVIEDFEEGAVILP